MTRIATLIEMIDAHLSAHPQAADSAEGVARWWVAPQGMVAPRAEVELALETLVRQRRLRRVKLADGNTLYCGALSPDMDSKQSN